MNSYTQNKVSKPLAIWRGLTKRCPKCGEGRIFGRYLKPAGHCSACGEPFGHYRTDDFAPWLAIVVIGHIVVPAAYYTERLWSPATWVHLSLWLPLIVILALAFLPNFKGTCLGIMWSVGISGSERQP